MLPILARTLRGLEWIGAAEVQARLGPPRIEHGHRELRFSVPELTEELTALGTVDDVFVVAATFDGVDRGRESLQRLAATQVDLDAYASLMLVSRHRVALWEALDLVALLQDIWTHVDPERFDETVLLLERHLIKL